MPPGAGTASSEHGSASMLEDAVPPSAVAVAALWRFCLARPFAGPVLPGLPASVPVPGALSMKPV